MRLASKGAVVIQWLQEKGIWKQIGHKGRVQREGGYSAVDAVLFMILYFTRELKKGFKEFAERTRECRERLAALGGRKTLPLAVIHVAPIERCIRKN